MSVAHALEVQALSQEAMDQLFFESRTINSFSGDPLTEEQMKQVYEAAKMPPTMMNAQPLRIDWLQSEEARAKVAAHMGGSNGKKTLEAPTVAVLSYDVDFHEHLPFTFPHFAEAKDMFTEEGPRAERALENAWMQAAYFIMAVRALGYSAGPMTGGDLAAITDVLNEGTAHKAFMVVSIAQPGENPYFQRLPRFEFEQVNRVL